MGFGRGKTLGKFGDPLEGDLGAADDGKDGHHLFEWSLHVQQDHHEASDGGRIGRRPVGLERKRQTDHHEEQHRAEGLGQDEYIDGADVEVADVVRGFADAAGVHAIATGAVDAQFLRARSDGGVVLLQFVFEIARGIEPFEPAGARQVLGCRADDDGDDCQQEHRDR